MTVHFVRYRSVLAAFVLAACNGRLEVTDEDIGSGGSNSSPAGSGGSSGSAGLPGSGGAGTDVASCGDGLRDGDETDVDCGGVLCTACPSEPGCTNPIQCEHGVCLDGLCQPPSCEDGVRNGDEAGVDCGGPQPLRPVLDALSRRVRCLRRPHPARL